MINSPGLPCPSVSVDNVDGQWIVTIIESEGRSRREFAVESFARSFADGQRRRLGLMPVDGPTAHPHRRKARRPPAPGANGRPQP